MNLDSVVAGDSALLERGVLIRVSPEVESRRL